MPRATSRRPVITQSASLCSIKPPLLRLSNPSSKPSGSRSPWLRFYAIKSPYRFRRGLASAATGAVAVSKPSRRSPQVAGVPLTWPPGCRWCALAVAGAAVARIRLIRLRCCHSVHRRASELCYTSSNRPRLYYHHLPVPVSRLVSCWLPPKRFHRARFASVAGWSVSPVYLCCPSLESPACSRCHGLPQDRPCFHCC